MDFFLCLKSDSSKKAKRERWRGRGGEGEAGRESSGGKDRWEGEDVTDTSKDQEECVFLISYIYI